MTNRSSAPLFLVFAFLLLLFVAPPAAGQLGSGTIVVTVVDVAGATWPKAMMAAVNTRTFVMRKKLANVEGVALLDVPEGQYVLIVADSNQCLTPAVQQIRVKSKQSIQAKLVLRLDEKFENCGEPIQ